MYSSFIFFRKYLVLDIVTKKFLLLVISKWWILLIFFVHHVLSIRPITFLKLLVLNSLKRYYYYYNDCTLYPEIPSPPFVHTCAVVCLIYIFYQTQIFISLCKLEINPKIVHKMRALHMCCNTHNVHTNVAFLHIMLNTALHMCYMVHV